MHQRRCACSRSTANRAKCRESLGLMNQSGTTDRALGHADVELLGNLLAGEEAGSHLLRLEGVCLVWR